MKPLALAAPGSRAVLPGGDVSELSELLVERCGLAAEGLYDDSRKPPGGFTLIVARDDVDVLTHGVRCFAMTGPQVVQDLVEVLGLGIRLWRDRSRR